MKRILFLFFLFISLKSFACHNSSATLISETDNGNGTYTYVINICLELGDIDGAPSMFTLTPSGGTYTSITTTTPTSFNNSGTIYNKSIAGSVIKYTTSDIFPNSSPNIWCVPQVTFTTNGRPTKITVNTDDIYAGTTCDKIINIPSCTPPATPILTTTAASCSAAGSSTISNYNAANTYTFTPAGPTVGAGGSITGMITGTSYTVIAAASGCSSTASSSFSNTAQLTTPATPTATLTQPTCATPTGSITITAPIGAYTYNSNGGAFQNTTSFSSLNPNTYTITVKNASGCTSTANFIINSVPSGPATPTATLTQPTCATPTGSITITAPIGAYTYNINGGAFQAGTSFSNLSPNTYTIIAKDGTGCTSTANFTINTAPGGPATPSATLIQPTCATPTGSITITAPIGAYTYNINGGAFQAGTSFPNLSPNTYTIIAKDGTGCTSTASFTINTAPGGPATPTATLIQPTCATPTGSITITAPIGAYTYNINGGAFQAGTSFPNLSPNTYTIIAKDGTGCTSTANFTINSAPGGPATPTATLTQPTCSVSTGVINITSPTGVGYTYSIDGTNFQAGTSFSGLSANNYTLTVKNASGCSSTNVVTLNNPPGAPAAATTTLTQPTCTVNTGSINITAPIGIGLTYSIDGTNFQVGTTFTGLQANNYTITVKDAGGCTSTTSITITPAPTPPAIPTATLTQPTCSTPTGTITLTTPIGSYTYNINGGTFQVGTTFTNLTPNTYTIIVKDGNGCTSTANFIINAIPGGPATPTATLIQPTCTVPTGTITITGPLGVLTYSNNGGSFQNLTTFSNLTPNTYTIIAKDASGCTSSSNFIINAAPVAPALETSNLIQPTCSVNTGSINILSPIGVGFTYSIDGTTFQTGTSFSGLVPATYTITVKNAAGCSSTNSETIISQPVTPTTPTTNITQPTCLIPTGSIVISTPTGIGYTYSIDGTTFQASTSFNGLTPNNYTLTVKNASGCTSTTNFTINSVPLGPNQPTFSIIQPTCPNPTGSIQITSPVGAYSYSIDGTNFQNSTLFSGLNPNSYTITVKDGIGCKSNASVTINNLPLPPNVATTNVTQPTCQISTGTIFINSPLGAYTYSIDGINYKASTVFNALPSNTTYTVTVKDLGGCISTTQVTINPSLLVPNLPTTSITNASCSSNVGSIIVTSPVGVGYSYSIDGINFQLSSTFKNIQPNTYNLTVKNVSGCTNASLFTINVPPPPPSHPFAIPKQPSCTNNTGEISILSPIGANYKYSIDSINYQSSTLFDSLITGNYTIYVKDSNNCYSNSKFTINPQPSIPKASFTFTPNELTILNTTVDFINQSTNASSYEWNFADGSNVNLSVNPSHDFPNVANIYFVKLTAFNKDNCSDDTIIPITIIEVPIIYVPNSFTPNGDEINNTFNPVIGGGIANENYSLYIFDRWGELLFESHNKDYGWDGTYGNKICLSDTYIWKIEYKENTGSKLKKQLVGHVNLIY